MNAVGRGSWVFWGGGIGLVVLLVLAFLGGESPSSVAGRFMGALAKGDYKTLAKLSHAPDYSEPELEEAWKYTTQIAAKHYLFQFAIKGEMLANETTASARMKVWKNLGPSSYDEEFDLPMEKIGGKWKVDVGGLSRKMYPALPRLGTKKTG